MLETIAAASDLVAKITQNLNSLVTSASTTDDGHRLIETGQMVVQLSASLMAEQAKNAALLKRERDLEEEIVQLKNWNLEKPRYQLVSIWAGAFAYALKPSMSNGEPAHWLCTTCYEHGKKSILVATKHKDYPRFGAQCPVCKVFMISEYNNPSPHEFAPE